MGSERLSNHRFGVDVVGAYCRFYASKVEGASWQHTHADDEPCPLNMGRPWVLRWKAKAS